MYLLIFILAYLTFAGPYRSAFAQQPFPLTSAAPGQPTKQADSPQTARPTIAVAPEAVPLTEVTKRLATSRRLLREISEKPEEPGFAAVAKEVDATRNAFPEEVRRASDAIRPPVEADNLRDLEIAWKTRAAQVAKWKAMVSDWSSRLYKDFTLIDQEEKTWELSLKSYSGRSFPREIERAIRELLLEAKKVKSQVQQRLDAVVSVENQLYQRETSISVVLGNISLAKDRFRGSLTVAERSPLWETAGQWDQVKMPPGGIFSEVSPRFADSREFLEAHSRLLAALVFFFGTMLSIALLMRKKVETWSEDHPYFKTAKHFLWRPVSLAFLITLVAAAFFFGEITPRLLIESIALLLVIPVLRLLPNVLHPVATPILFIIVGFELFEILRNLFVVIPFLDRLAFVFGDLVAVVILVWCSRSSRIKKRFADNPAPAYVVFALRIVLLLLCASIVLNIMGYFDLARVLSNGILYSAYAAFIFQGMALAVSVLFTVFLDTEIARSLSAVRTQKEKVLWWTCQLFNFAAFVLWANLSLRVFSVRDDVTNAVVSFFSAPIKEGRINFSLWDVIAFVLVLAAAVAISRVVRLILQEDVFPKMRVPRGVPEMITTTVYYVLLLFGFFMALGMAGVDVNRFTLLAGAFGVGVGFGLQNVISNFISGLILLFERPIHPGDTVEVSGIEGVVKKIGIRSSTIATGDGADAIIPNATLISDKLINWTLTHERRRIAVKVGVSYGSDVEKVMRVFHMVAAASPEALRELPAEVLFLGFNEGMLNFELRCWVGFRNHVEARSQLSIAAARALQEAGIEISYPERELRLRPMDERAEELLARAAFRTAKIK